MVGRKAHGNEMSECNPFHPSQHAYHNIGITYFNLLRNKEYVLTNNMLIDILDETRISAPPESLTY